MQLRDFNWHKGVPQLFVIRQCCPLCKATEFQYSIQTSFTRLLRLAAIRRVRCMNCWRRYYWLKMRTSRN